MIFDDDPTHPDHGTTSLLINSRLERLDLRATIENPINSGNRDKDRGDWGHDQNNG